MQNQDQARRLAGIAALLAALGVGCGAFAAHVLKDQLEPSLLEAFRTGALYHLLHAIAALALAAWAAHEPQRRGLLVAGWLLLVGIVLFSGSLYALALSGLRALGAITPLGGLAFIAGWLVAATSLLRRRR